MSNKTIATIAGFALVGSLGAVGLAQAAENPFAAKSMNSGYLQIAEADKKAEGKCGGEAKCGGDKKAGEGKCGGDKKAGEAKCGGDKKAGEGKCGGAK